MRHDSWTLWGRFNQVKKPIRGVRGGAITADGEHLYWQHSQPCHSPQTYSESSSCPSRSDFAKSLSLRRGSRSIWNHHIHLCFCNQLERVWDWKIQSWKSSILVRVQMGWEKKGKIKGKPAILPHQLSCSTADSFTCLVSDRSVIRLSFTS